MRVITRDLQKHEIAIITEFGREYHAETTFHMLAFDPDILAEKLAKIILDTANFFVKLAIVVHDDGREDRIGLLIAKKVTPIYSNDEYAQDVIFVVRKEMRTRFPQAALLLLKDYKRWAIDGGCKMIFLATISGIEMERTAEFFNRLGFVKVGTYHAMGL